jgi:hypothetical protein
MFNYAPAGDFSIDLTKRNDLGCSLFRLQYLDTLLMFAFEMAHMVS